MDAIMSSSVCNNTVGLTGLARCSRNPALSARLRSEHLDEFTTEIERDRPPITLDLDGIMLVDVEVVRFLNTCEANNIELLHCSPYIREWMIREQAGKE